MDIAEFTAHVKARSALGFHSYSDFTNVEHVRGKSTIISAPFPGKDIQIPVGDGFFAVLRANGDALFVMEADLVAPPRFSDAVFEAKVRLDTTQNTAHMFLSIEDVIAYVDIAESSEAKEASDAWAQATHGVSTEDFLTGFITEHKVTRSETLRKMAKEEMAAAGLTVEDMRRLGIPEDFMRDLGIVD